MSSDVRGRILSSTLDLIGERGIGGLSNRLVAKSAGVSLGTLTYHFSSQDELLSEALQTFVDTEVERLLGIAVELEGSVLTTGEALARTRVAIEDRAGRSAQIAQLELYVHATRNDKLRAAAAQCYEAYDRVAAAGLKALGVPEPDRVAPTVGALIDGLELRRLAVGGLSVDLAEALAALISGLAPTAITRQTEGR
ncbi:TetR/AcrR family transcriptional regulator [Mycolicibacterium fortuitum]|uniref:TetR/AcrR family transcriptional regulator n=1 Tax=Mycolicibacterium fortuitum TaxID=1766 RepID=UPI000AB8F26B|nr:TetR family transcriptional regulator [Mycolicibacterium fortuitum]